MFALGILSFIGALVIAFNFIYFLIYHKFKASTPVFIWLEVWAMIITPLGFLLESDIGKLNECCVDSAFFSPEDRIGIYALIVLYTAAYFLSTFKKHLLNPIPEVALNVMLIMGLIINIFLCIHVDKVLLGTIMWVFGDVPIIILLFMRLQERQKLLTDYIVTNQLIANNIIGKCCAYILRLAPAIKYPTLIILLLPALVLFSALLFLFGQKPDSLIRAFTDTYKHGFSQLDYMCDNVECGGHFLCSVGANGHKKIVKPLRYGERNGGKIICNRQLLISNAFEELVAENFPRIHTFIRYQYNKVGNLVHQYYGLFNIKLIADVVYIVMKPLEWLFLLILYSFDKKPENRIAKQYLKSIDKKAIEEKIKA